MRRLLYRLGIVNLVWTIDNDSEKRLRIVRYGSDQKLYVHGYHMDSLYELKSDGKAERARGKNGFVAMWEPYSKIPNVRTSLFRFLPKNKAIEIKTRLEK